LFFCVVVGVVVGGGGVLLPLRCVGVVAYELSQVLDTGLDKETLSILMALCENGVNPEALALVVKELKRESEDFRAQEFVS